MKVQLSRSALNDLDGIAGWIARDDPERALTFVAALRAKCAELATRHAVFPYARGYESSGLRRRLHGAYLIFYVVRGETVRIMHVVHSRRDYDRILSGGKD